MKKRNWDVSRDSTASSIIITRATRAEALFRLVKLDELGCMQGHLNFVTMSRELIFWFTKASRHKSTE